MSRPKLSQTHAISNDSSMAICTNSSETTTNVPAKAGRTSAHAKTQSTAFRPGDATSTPWTIAFVGPYVIAGNYVHGAFARLKSKAVHGLQNLTATNLASRVYSRTLG